MKAESYNISLSFSQILDLIKQLPRSQKLKISKELEKEAINSKLKDFLTSFKTDELTDEVISEEVAKVRKRMYVQSKRR